MTKSLHCFICSLSFAIAHDYYWPPQGSLLEIVTGCRVSEAKAALIYKRTSVNWSPCGGRGKGQEGGVVRASSQKMIPLCERYEYVFLHFDLYLYWLIWFSKLYNIILMLSYSQTDQANNASNSYKVFPRPVLPFNNTTLCRALHTGLQIWSKWIEVCFSLGRSTSDLKKKKTFYWKDVLFSL